MSGLDIFFYVPPSESYAEPIEYELTHQLMLYKLLNRSNLADYLFGFKERPKVLFEPRDGRPGLFDLSLNYENHRCFVEIKTLSLPNDKQIANQTQFLKREKAKGYYVLLGYAWKKRSDAVRKLQSVYDGWGFLGYDEIIHALDKLLTEPSLPSDYKELTAAYLDALKTQQLRYQPASESSNPLQP